ncbi:MAG: hypothetical protein IJ521_00100 [Schwartzia sp.]|nr:hypothetical protein [Schwartzia sp. (in: firmicutes)]
MIKQVWVAQCDLCGKIENAKLVAGRYNETAPTLPEGWICGYNKDFHCCPECAKQIEKE